MKEALKLALEALTYIYTETTADEDELIDQAITALRLAIDVQNMASESTYKAALAQPTSGDYALGYVEGFNDACKPKPAQRKPLTQDLDAPLTLNGVALYPQRTWVGLTEEEFQYCVELKNSEAIVEEVEAKLKELNT